MINISSIITDMDFTDYSAVRAARQAQQRAAQRQARSSAQCAVICAGRRGSAQVRRRQKSAQVVGLPELATEQSFDKQLKYAGQEGFLQRC